jgi:hypothetical protein
MNEGEYKDFLRNGPAFFVHSNMLEFLVFPGFLTPKGVFLPTKQRGSWPRLTVPDRFSSICGEDGIPP